MLRRVRFLVCVAAACPPIADARAGAFNRARGEGLVIYASGFSQFGRFVDGRGRARRQPGAVKFESSAHVEYELADWLTALVKPGFVTTRATDRLAPSISAGATLGLQVQAWRSDRAAIALQASARFARGDTGLAGTGEERAGFELRALAGRNVTVAGARLYFEGQAAYRARGDMGDEFMLDATVIAPISARTEFHVQSFSWIAPGSRAQAAATSHKVAATLLYRLNAAWSLAAGLFTTVHVRNARHETGATLALHRRF